MRTLTDRIIEAEGKFFDENVQSATILVLNPNSLAQLLDEKQMAWTDDLHSYEGLTVAVSNDPYFPEFVLAYGEVGR